MRGVVTLEPLLERVEVGVRGRGSGSDLRRAAPHHHEPLEVVRSRNSSMSPMQLARQVHLACALLDVRPVEVPDERAVEHAPASGGCRRARRARAASARAASTPRLRAPPATASSGKKSHPPKTRFSGFRAARTRGSAGVRPSLRLPSRMVCICVSEPKSWPSPFFCELDAGDEGAGDRAHAGEQDAEPAAARLDAIPGGSCAVEGALSSSADGEGAPARSRGRGAASHLIPCAHGLPASARPPPPG